MYVELISQRTMTTLGELPCETLWRARLTTWSSNQGVRANKWHDLLILYLTIPDVAIQQAGQRNRTNSVCILVHTCTCILGTFRFRLQHFCLYCVFDSVCSKDVLGTNLDPTTTVYPSSTARGGTRILGDNRGSKIYCDLKRYWRELMWKVALCLSLRWTFVPHHPHVTIHRLWAKYGPHSRTVLYNPHTSS